MGNSHESVIPYELLMGKLAGVGKCVDVHGCIVCTLYVMYVSVSNSQERVITCKLSM